MDNATSGRGRRELSRRGLLLGVGGAGLLGLTALSASPARAGEPVLDHSEIATNMVTQNKNQAFKALILQTYAHSVLAQPPVNFSAQPGLAKYQESINAGLKAAQGHAKSYLYAVQPDIIRNIANIEAYYSLHNAVPATLQPGESEATWIEMLHALRKEAGIYKLFAASTVARLTKLREDLEQDVTAFKVTTDNLNAAVKGDKGAISEIERQLSRIQSEIDSNISDQLAASRERTAGSVLLIVGSVTPFFPLAMGGVGLLIFGENGGHKAAQALKDLNDQKASLLTQESKLMEEVTVATHLSSAYDSLHTQVEKSVEAASDMSTAWHLLGDSLDTMVRDIGNGLVNTGKMREWWLNAANNVITPLLQDIAIVKEQMTGARVLVAEPGQTVGDAILKAVA